MNNTPNYGYNLPEYLEDADVVILNQNFTAIDKDILDVRQIAVLMYDSDERYDTDDLVGYENPTDHHIRMFRCLDDNVTGQWDSTKWTNTNVAAELLRRSGGGTEVEANPSGSATDYLTKVRIGNTIYAVTPADMTGATSQAAGAHGLVPAPSAGDEGKVLYGDGTWKTPQSAPSNLGDLGDVTLTTPTEGQILEYDGDEWVNTDAPDVDVTKTASGNPIEVSDGANAPLVKCVTEIQGSQDLHGQDKPWVGGAGKNKLEVTTTTQTVSGVTFTVNNDGTIQVSGTNSSGGSISITIGNVTLPQGTYTISTGNPTGAANDTHFLNIDPRETGSSQNENVFTTYTFTDSAETTHTIKIYVRSGKTVNALYKPMVESGSIATTFQPYSNICPITAYTEGEIEVRGKNLFDKNDPDTINGYFNTSNTSIVESANAKTIYIPCKPNTTYTIGKNAGTRFSVGYTDALPSVGSSVGGIVTSNTASSITITTGVNAAYLVSFVYNASSDTGTAQDMYDSIMISESATPIPYEPYTSTTHSTTFPSAIFRGSEDVVNGEVTSEKVLFEFTSGVELYGNYGDENAPLFYITLPKNVVKYVKPDPTVVTPISNVYNANTASTGQGMHDFEFRTNNNVSSKTVYFRDSRFTTASEVNTHIANNPLQFVFMLYASETEQISVSNAPIKSLSGYSHIESSTGEMEIEYIVGKYNPIIEIAEREIKTIDEMLTENIESSMVASQNYTTGELIIACGKIYRATANIASGSNLTVGTNVVKTTIEDEIARSGGGANYSTTEHVVGTWIDGSTVYEKTFSFSIPSNNYTTETTGITNFDKCVGYSGIVALGNGYYEDINYGRPDSSNSTYYISITTMGDIFFKTYEASSGTAYITMRYTKSS